MTSDPHPAKPFVIKFDRYTSFADLGSPVHSLKPRSGTEKKSRIIRTWYRILFYLHLRNTYPTYITGFSNEKIEANIIRCNIANQSSFVKPDTKQGNK